MKTYRSGRSAIAATMLGMAALGACTHPGYMEGRVASNTDAQGKCHSGCTIDVKTGHGVYSITVFLVSADSFPEGIHAGDEIIFPLQSNIDGSPYFKNGKKASIPAYSISIIKKPGAIQ